MIIKANGEPKFMPLYEALASEVRWKMMSLLADCEMNVKDIANRLELSPSIVTMHIRKLEQAGLVGSRRVRLNGGRTKSVSSSKKPSKLSCRLPAPPQRSGSKVFPSVITPLLKFILLAGSVHARKKSEFGTIRAISSIPSGFTPPFCGLGGGMWNTKCLTFCWPIKPRTPSKSPWRSLRKLPV